MQSKSQRTAKNCENLNITRTGEMYKKLNGIHSLIRAASEASEAAALTTYGQTVIVVMRTSLAPAR